MWYGHCTGCNGWRVIHGPMIMVHQTWPDCIRMQCMMYYARKEDRVYKVIVGLADVRVLCCARCRPQSAIVLVLERHEKGWCLWGEKPKKQCVAGVWCIRWYDDNHKKATWRLSLFRSVLMCQRPSALYHVCRMSGQWCLFWGMLYVRQMAMYFPHTHAHRVWLLIMPWIVPLDRVSRFDLHKQACDISD